MLYSRKGGKYESVSAWGKWCHWKFSRKTINQKKITTRILIRRTASLPEEIIETVKSTANNKINADISAKWELK
jgi:hypothetical protein